MAYKISFGVNRPERHMSSLVLHKEFLIKPALRVTSKLNEQTGVFQSVSECLSGQFLARTHCGLDFLDSSQISGFVRPLGPSKCVPLSLVFSYKHWVPPTCSS